MPSRLVLHERLRAALKPFLLRRLKSEVVRVNTYYSFLASEPHHQLSGSASLPPKKSYVVYAGLSATQKTLYEVAVRGELRAWASGSTEGNGEVKSHRWTRARKQGGRSQDEIEKQALGVFPFLRGIPSDNDLVNYSTNQSLKHANALRLQNTAIQCRKVCAHPALIPVYGASDDFDVVGQSGKMMLLERLLKELFHRGHKVLLFSQFTTMLDIIEVRVHICLHRGRHSLCPGLG